MAEKFQIVWFQKNKLKVKEFHMYYFRTLKRNIFKKSNYYFFNL